SRTRRSARNSRTADEVRGHIPNQPLRSKLAHRGRSLRPRPEPAGPRASVSTGRLHVPAQHAGPPLVVALPRIARAIAELRPPALLELDARRLRAVRDEPHLQLERLVGRAAGMPRRDE